MNQLLEECVNDLCHNIGICRGVKPEEQETPQKLEDSDKDQKEKKMHNHITEKKGFLELNINPYKPGSNNWFFPASEVYVYKPEKKPEDD